MSGIENPEFLYFTDAFAMQREFYRERWRGYWFVAHNLQFDLAQIFGQEIPAELCLIGSNLYFAKLEVESHSKYRTTKTGQKRDWKQYIHFADTTRHCPKSLASIGKDIGINKAFDDYESKHPESLPERDLCFGVSQDALICGHFASELQNIYNAKGASFRYTIGSTCLELYRRKYMKSPIVQMDKEDLSAFLLGYYGGRCEAFWVGTLPPGTYYLGDINSMYPSVMRDLELPIPSREHVWYERNPRKFVLERPGMSECTVTVPLMMYPPLPYRRPTDGKLLFPCGTFTGFWTHNEIEYALQCGATLDRIHQSWWFDASCTPFREYVDDVYAMRRAGGFLNLVGKLLGNNLYGKMGQSNAPGSLVTWERYQEMIREGDSTAQLALNERATVYEKDGEPIAVCIQSDEKLFPKHSNIIWASYITSAARIKLHQFLAPASGYYCDTDSVLTSRPVESTSELGILALKNTYNSCEIIGPKSYRFGSDIALKGVPKRSGWKETDNGSETYTKIEDIREAALAGHRVAYRAPLKLKESFIRETLPEMVSNDDGSLFKLVQNAVESQVNRWHPKVKHLSRTNDKRVCQEVDGWTTALVL